MVGVWSGCQRWRSLSRHSANLFCGIKILIKIHLTEHTEDLVSPGCEVFRLSAKRSKRILRTWQSHQAPEIAEEGWIAQRQIDPATVAARRTRSLRERKRPALRASK